MTRFSIVENWLDICSINFGVSFLEVQSMEMIIGALGFGIMFLFTGLVDILIDRFQYQIEISKF